MDPGLFSGYPGTQDLNWRLIISSVLVYVCGVPHGSFEGLNLCLWV